MPEAKRFAYSISGSDLGEASLMPYLPVALTSGQKTAHISALVDSGATVNVLPHAVGLQLGLVWEEQETAITLSGNLARLEARAILLTAEVSGFPPIRLAFAWAKSNEIPPILGQTNFFMEFNVCFFRTQQVFEIQPK